MSTLCSGLAPQAILLDTIFITMPTLATKDPLFTLECLLITVRKGVFVEGKESLVIGARVSGRCRLGSLLGPFLRKKEFLTRILAARMTSNDTLDSTVITPLVSELESIDLMGQCLS